MLHTDPALHSIATASTAWTVAGFVLLAFAVLLVVALIQKVRDADVQSRMQRRLDETERLKDLSIMAGGLAHEIRHPVSSVQFALNVGRLAAAAIERGARARHQRLEPR
jgi:signal transduction histidine kinase